MYDAALAIQRDRRCQAAKIREASRFQTERTFSLGRYRVTLSKVERQRILA